MDDLTRIVTVVEDLSKEVSGLVASFAAYKEDLDYAKQSRALLHEHTLAAEKQLQELRDMMKEHERRLATLEEVSRQNTRDSEEGDSDLRSEMNTGFQNLQLAMADIKAAAGKAAIRGWIWLGGIVGAAIISTLLMRLGWN